MEKLIFRKFLNIQMMANLRQSTSRSPGLYGEGFDELFDIYLRPLRSRNARTIYRIFLDEREKGELTTLDLQTRLDQHEISLSKKEINAWLRSLQEAHLISKGEERGKPTTMEYRGRYTFDLWRVTPKGLEMADAIKSILVNGERRAPHELDVLAAIIDEADVVQSRKILYGIEESYILLFLIKTLSKAGHPLNYDELEHKIIPLQTTLSEVILSRSGQKFLEVATDQASRSIIDKIFRFLGIPSRGENLVSLTNDGMRLARRLWRKDFSDISS
jgi:DNA-binding transcriptional ArsR family regulator